jgi:cyanophycinase
LNPIYLFADSIPLFSKQADGSSFLREVVQSAGVERPSVAYVGASNDDNLVFYHEIFLPAFEQAETGESRMVLARPTRGDGAFLERADIILLAGGSVEHGWRTFEGNGFKSLIGRRYLEGAMLLGISAGAVQIGRGGLTDDESTLFPTFGFLPLYVGTHEEHDDWKSLRRILSFNDGPAQGVGIQAGGGLLYLGGEVLPVCKPLFEIWVDGPGSREDLVFPPQHDTNNGICETERRPVSQRETR